ncbi:hypothetical protein [Maribellus sp. YY47]|uniref:hypothetical protein n=1 Tax=Maribellus sp. YY47 TaxID=2929486 RepID=UPI0020016BD0|nr:hypothetical protein [Maribellus sp. YY47]MCK3684644.1 hypothetical protein [Maribellus sp. YY47]
MKQNLSFTLILIFLIVLSSCDKINETKNVNINTTMSMEIPVSVKAPISATVKSAQVSYSFSDSLTQSIEEVEKLTGYLDLMKSMIVEDVYVVFSGLQENQTIERIDFSLDGVGLFATIENVTSATLNQQPEVNKSLLVLIGNVLRANNELKLTVSGTANNAPMTFNVTTYFDLHIVAAPLE